MRKQNEDKGVPSRLRGVSAAGGGGSERKEDNVETELKLESPSETKVKPRAMDGRRTPWGNAPTPMSRHNARGYFKI